MLGDGGDGRERVGCELASGAGRREIDPDKIVGEACGVGGGEDFFRAKRVMRREGGDVEALSGGAVELPAVIGAFDGSLRLVFAGEQAAVGERDAAMRAGVAQGEGGVFGCESEGERNAAESGLCEFAGA